MKYEVLQAGPKSWTWHVRVGRHVTNSGHGLDTQEKATRAICQHVVGQAKFILKTLYAMKITAAQEAEIYTAIRRDVKVIKKLPNTKEK
jgi:hypothetical protein